MLILLMEKNHMLSYAPKLNHDVVSSLNPLTAKDAKNLRKGRKEINTDNLPLRALRDTNL